MYSRFAPNAGICLRIMPAVGRTPSLSETEDSKPGIYLVIPFAETGVRLFGRIIALNRLACRSSNRGVPKNPAQWLQMRVIEIR